MELFLLIFQTLQRLRQRDALTELLPGSFIVLRFSGRFELQIPLTFDRTQCGSLNGVRFKAQHIIHESDATAQLQRGMLGQHIPVGQEQFHSLCKLTQKWFEHPFIKCALFFCDHVQCLQNFFQKTINNLESIKI